MDFTSDLENKVGWGTSILSHIDGDTIYIVSDGRCSSENAQGVFITKGNDEKIYKVSDTICATTAGNVEICNEMLHIISKEAENSEDSSKMSTKLKKYVEKYHSNKDKEMWRSKNKKQDRVKPLFKAHFGLNSLYGCNRKPSIELMGFKNFTSDEDGAVLGSGTGGEAAKAHFTELVRQREPRTAVERLSYMKKSIVASGLDDPYTGGFLQEAILSPNGLAIEVQRDHIIKHVADNHQHFVNILSRRLLCITRDFAYKVENEETMANLINMNFHGVLKPKELFLGVHEHLIVRCLVFLNQATADRAFHSVRVRGDHAMQLRLNSGAVHQVEIKRPTRDEFIVLARDFRNERSDL